MLGRVLRLPSLPPLWTPLADRGRAVSALADERNAEAKAALTKAVRAAFLVRGGVRSVEMWRLADAASGDTLLCNRTCACAGNLVASDGGQVDALVAELLAEARLLNEAMGEESTRFLVQFHRASASSRHLFRLYNAPLFRCSCGCGEAACVAPKKTRKCDECGAPREGGESHCRYCKTATG